MRLLYKILLLNIKEIVLFELSHPKKRNKFIDNLNHRWEEFLDMRKLQAIPKEKTDNYEYVKAVLSLNDNELCYTLSNYLEPDDQFSTFTDAYYDCYGKELASLIMGNATIFNY